jgi:N-acetylneuraminic acid mutarotase
MMDRRTGRVLRLVIAAVLALLLIAVAAIVVLRLTNPHPRAEVGWLRGQDMPDPRGEMASAMAGSRLVVAGGLYGVGRASNAVDVYDMVQRQWVIAPPLPARRHHAAAAALDDSVYVTGGAASVTDSTPRRDMWRAQPGGTWEALPLMPEGRAGHAMVAFGSRLYVFGGVGRTNTTLIYDPAHDWTNGAPLPAGRNHLRAVVWGKEIWVIGGRTSKLMRRVDIYDPETDHWRRGPDLPKPMSAMVVAVLDGKLHVIGGENPAFLGGRVLTEHFVLPAGSTTWERRAPPALPVHGAGFGAYQGAVLVVAGGATRPGALSVLSWTGVTQIYSTIPQQRM